MADIDFDRTQFTDSIKFRLGIQSNNEYLNAWGVEGRWDPNFDLLGEERRLEVRLDHHLDLQLGPADLANQGNHPERKRNVFGRAVPETG